MSASDDGETQSSLLLRLDGLRRGTARARGSRLVLLALDASELFSVGEDEVHVLVKGKHLTGHCPAIVEGDPHPPVDVTGHLSLLVRHLDDCCED